LPAPAGPEADRAILAALREHGLDMLPWNGARGHADTLRDRLGWLQRGLGPPWPDMSDAALLDRLEEWLLPRLTGEASLNAIEPHQLRAALLSLVPSQLQHRVDLLAPTHFDAPSGSKVPIRYDGEWPVLSIRVQELFGLGSHPAIAGGRVPLTV